MAFAGTRYVEYIGGSPYVDSITTTPFTLDADGYLPIPNLPGLGVELDPDKLEQFVDDPKQFLQP